MTETPVRGRTGRPRVRLDVDHARQLRHDGLSWRQIASALGVGKTTLLRYLGSDSAREALYVGPKAVQYPPTPKTLACPRCGSRFAP